jgi:hypothetical protein
MLIIILVFFQSQLFLGLVSPTIQSTAFLSTLFYYLLLLGFGAIFIIPTVGQFAIFLDTAHFGQNPNPKFIN